MYIPSPGWICWNLCTPVSMDSTGVYRNTVDCRYYDAVGMKICVTIIAGLSIYPVQNQSDWCRREYRSGIVGCCFILNNVKSS